MPTIPPNYLPTPGRKMLFTSLMAAPGAQLQLLQIIFKS